MNIPLLWLRIKEQRQEMVRNADVTTAEDVDWLGLNDTLMALCYEKRSRDERLNAMPLLITLNEVLHFRLDAIFNNGP